MEVAQSLPGVMQTLAATVRQFEISSGVCSRFKPLILPLLRSWKMDPWLLGVIENSGGDSSAVRDQLKGVQQIQATHGALCCLCCDSGRWICRYLGSCRLWWWQFGQFEISWRVCTKFKPHVRLLLRFWQMDPSLPGVMQSVAATVLQFRDQLRGVQQIQATSGAFAAILEDGSVVTWGDADCGGDSSPVRDQLKGVQQIQVTWHAFAAILEDGSVVTWGRAASGGDSSAVQDQLKGCAADSSLTNGLCCHSGR